MTTTANKPQWCSFSAFETRRIRFVVTSPARFGYPRKIISGIKKWEEEESLFTFNAEDQIPVLLTCRCRLLSKISLVGETEAERVAFRKYLKINETALRHLLWMLETCTQFYLGRTQSPMNPVLPQSSPSHYFPRMLNIFDVRLSFISIDASALALYETCSHTHFQIHISYTNFKWRVYWKFFLSAWYFILTALLWYCRILSKFVTSNKMEFLASCRYGSCKTFSPSTAIMPYKKFSSREYLYIPGKQRKCWRVKNTVEATGQNCGADL